MSKPDTPLPGVEMTAELQSIINAIDAGYEPRPFSKIKMRLQCLFELLDELLCSSHELPSEQRLLLVNTSINYISDICKPSRYQRIASEAANSVPSPYIVDDFLKRLYRQNIELADAFYKEVSAQIGLRKIKRLILRDTFFSYKASSLDIVMSIERALLEQLDGRFEDLIYSSVWQDIVDPLFAESRSDYYQDLYDYYVGRVVNVGVSSNSLNVIHRAAKYAESIEVMANSWEQLISILSEHLIDMKTHTKMFSENGTIATLAMDSAGTSCATVFQCAKVLRTTALSLWRPQIARREARPDPPPGSLAARAIVSIKHSWQAKMVSLPLRLWVKQKMKGGNVDEWRGRLAKLDGLKARYSKGLNVTDIDLSGVKLQKIVSSNNLNTNTRVLLYLPGGGFIFPATPMHTELVSELAKLMEADGYLLHYRLAPEFSFPAPLEDALNAYQYLINSGVDASRIVIAGESAGGGLVLSLIQAIRAADKPMPGAVVAMSALTDLAYTGESRVYNRLRDPILPIDRSIDLNSIYLGSFSENHPLVSPVFGDFTDCPPLFIQVGSTEILLDDSLRVAAAARACGVSTRVEVWREMPHAWQLISMLPETQYSIQHIAAFVREKIIDKNDINASAQHEGT